MFIYPVVAGCILLLACWHAYQIGVTAQVSARVSSSYLGSVTLHTHRVVCRPSTRQGLGAVLSSRGATSCTRGHHTHRTKHTTQRRLLWTRAREQLNSAPGSDVRAQLKLGTVKRPQTTTTTTLFPLLFNQKYRIPQIT